MSQRPVAAILVSVLFALSGVNLAAAPSAAAAEGVAPRAGTVSLTFDDGPSGYTPQVLDILGQYGVKATFFVLGSEVQRYPDLIHRMVAEGHSVQSHSMTHPPLPGLSDAALQQQVVDSRSVINAVAGVAPRCMRPPYGARNGRTDGAMRAAGMEPVLWSIDTLDWKRPGADTIVARAVGQAQSGSVILMHDGGGDRSQTVAALSSIIQGIAGRGLGFDTICAQPEQQDEFLSCRPRAAMNADGSTAPAVFRPSDGTWHWRDHPENVAFGTRGDIPCPLPGVVDDPAVFRPNEGRWYTWSNPAGFAFGSPGDTPIAFRSESAPDLRAGVFRPATGCWYVLGLSESCAAFGGPGDLPVNADWNGDGGRDELGVFRGGTWFSQAFTQGIVFGIRGDIPVPCTWGGDPAEDIGVWRATEGRWYVDLNRDGTADINQPFGGPGDRATPGDYDGDGTCDLGVFRPSTGMWYMDTNRDGVADAESRFGAPGDVALVRRGS